MCTFVPRASLQPMNVITTKCRSRLQMTKSAKARSGEMLLNSFGLAVCNRRLAGRALTQQQEMMMMMMIGVVRY